MPTPNTSLTPLVSVTPILPTTAQGQIGSISVDTTVLPYIIYADVNTSQIEVLVPYNQNPPNKDPILVNGQNQFSGTITIDPTQGDLTIQILGRNYDPVAASWATNTAYALNFRLVDSNGYVQIVTKAGTSGTVATGPEWSKLVGTSTIDNGVVWNNLGYIAVTPTLKFVLIPYVSGSGALIGPPSAVRSYMAQNVCRIEWLEPTYPGIIGTRVMLSTDPTGINPTYVQYGEIVSPSQLSRSDTSVLAVESTTAYIDGVKGNQTLTTVNTVQQNNYNYVDVPQSDVGGANIFYAMLSTVIQDPNTQAIFESQQNGPITCGYVNLKLVQLTDFLALQRKEDIAGRMITQVNRNYPNLDLSPRSELRDLMIDPVAIELSNMSVREWFSRVSQSVSGLAQVDNANGNGISDPFNSSPVKQQISRAYGLNSSDTQTFINSQFDVLGERAGLIRMGATSSVVTVTFYTYVKPAASVAFSVGLVVSTVADAQTPALNFVTTGSVSVATGSINTYYDPINGWWAVSVPASCQSTGSNTNVGAGTINNAGSGTPSGWYCTNLSAAAFGQDDEINSSFASRILTRLATGTDSGTRNGYLTTAYSTPGITSAIVVAAGDAEMLRDWDPIRQKHVYGCVDIYTKGTSLSEQDEIVGFQYQNTGVFGSPSTYITLNSFNKNTLNAQIPNFFSLPYPLYQAVQLLATGLNGNFYFGLENSQFDNVNGYIILNPNDSAYTITDGVVSPLMTNKAAIAGLPTNATYQLFARYQSPLIDTPAFQPIISVNSVVGQASQTGTVATNLIDLIHTSDFLLNGGSNQAGDIVNVSTTATTPITKTITVVNGTTPVTIDSAMSLTVDTNGNIGNVVSVRSIDQSTLYGFGTDYTIVSTGPYHTYGIQPLTTVTCNVTGVQILGTTNQVIVTCNNKFGVGAQVTVNNLIAADSSQVQQVSTALPSNTILTVSSSDETSFTAAFISTLNTTVISISNGTVTGSTIQNNQQVLVTYNKFEVAENLTFISEETQALSGTSYSTLDNQGFVYNTWLPESYGNTSLTLDTDFNGSVGVQVPHDNRYIKVTYNGIVMVENQDYVLAVDSISGTAAIARSAANISTTHIPDGAAVSVSYFVTEAFTFATEYPAFVEVLVNKLAATKHAAADVLVKAMVANPVDVTMTVVLQPNASVDVVDPIIRSTIDLVFNNANGALYQSELVQQVMGITGVQTVNLPLVKCAKADGSYNIGVVIPTGTTWIPLSSDPAFMAAKVSTPTNSFITQSPVLPDSTKASGGEPEAFVGFLYQGQPYTRMNSIQQFLTTVAPTAALGLPLMSVSGSFYIIGTNDQINATTALSSAYNQKIIITLPMGVSNPSLYSFFVTYQVYGEGSASDINLSSTEYVVPGRCTINYSSST